MEDLTQGRTPSGDRPEPVTALPDALLADLSSIDGVRGWLAAAHQPDRGRGPVRRLHAHRRTGVVPGARRRAGPGPLRARARTWPWSSPGSTADRAALDEIAVADRPALTAAELGELPVQGLGVSTDGSRAAIERARTALTAAFPDRAAPATVAENRADADIAQQLAGFQRLAQVVTIGSLCIAGCSLAVSVVAGLNDRKRPFSLLRLAGVPLAALRRSMALETAVPLLSVAAVAVGHGAPRRRAVPAVAAAVRACTHRGPPSGGSSSPGWWRRSPSSPRRCRCCAG